MVVDFSAFAGDRAIQEVAGVELNTRLIGENLQNAPTLGLISLGREKHAAFPPAIQYPVVVISLAEFDLLIVGVNASTDGGWLGEIEGGAFHGTKLASRDQSL